MKYLTLLLAALLLTNCSEIDKLTKFDLDYNSSVTIKSSTGINLPINLRTPEMETNSESEFESNNTRKNLIEEIILKRMRLTITSPSNRDFSFLKSIEIFIAAEGVEERSIAVLDPVSGNGKMQIELNTSDADLKAYIKKDSFTLRVNTVTDEAITQDVDIDILSVFAVDAKIFGV